MIKNIFWISITAVTLVTSSCATRKVARVDPNQQIDLSGRWNDVDSKLTADAMTQQALGEIWLENFMRKNNGEQPVVIVGMVTNKSHEHIEAETFIKDLEKSFIKSQRVRLVQAGDKREEIRKERADQQTNSSVSTMKKFGLEIGADFILQGSINSIVDAYKKDKVVYYQIDLELTNLQTNEVVWIGDKKIKKLVKN
ncbi:penicillin-binding protein activator LpoB [uncultured Cytophaga sp.]|uniref:penicillin-binding protein activator LpoB n=1 Tax=uncultured Cytophaga sp. TaxID=160238 RepID=UPI0026267AF1|nr:penicillin-binding protein activator LpoB [uncultured Cytophaga sp.]